MTREEAREFLINISYKLGNMSVEYLSEKDGEKMRNAIKALEQEPPYKNDLGVDCISRKAAEDITWQDPSYTDPLNILTEVRDKIRELPSVTPQEPRKGHWINTANPCMSDNIVCSECGYNSIADFNFCPNCGADMRGEE